MDKIKTQSEFALPYSPYEATGDCHDLESCARLHPLKFMFHYNDTPQEIKIVTDAFDSIVYSSCDPDIIKKLKMIFDAGVLKGGYDESYGG